VSAGGSEIVAAALDVRDLAQVQELAAEVLARFGRVDLVVNNAGVIGPRVYVWEQDESDWRWVHEVNFFGVMNGVRAFVPHLVEARRGHVVNTASVTGIGLLGGGIGTYAASKHAIVGLTEWLRHELDHVAPRSARRSSAPDRCRRGCGTRGGTDPISTRRAPATRHRSTRRSTTTCPRSPPTRRSSSC
jgi:NAD(P)-dependent dehydrogenase (short-subunit alcohol dehydrogenase family)